MPRRRSSAFSHTRRSRRCWHAGKTRPAPKSGARGCRWMSGRSPKKVSAPLCSISRAAKITAWPFAHAPRLVAVEQIRGDLHMHTTETDGRATLEEMAEAARRHGYEYIAITDHSKALAMANGLDEA